jgi:putative oxidoreductase
MLPTTVTLAADRTVSDAVQNHVRDPVLFVARILIAALFIYDATMMIRAPAAIIAYMQQYGLPGALLYPTAILQFAGGLMIVIGWRARLAGLALAAFCVATALIFHSQFSDPDQLIEFGKDLGLAGGFLMLAASGPGAWSTERLVRRTSR